MSRRAKFLTLLGEPGSGKSTFVYDLVMKSNQRTLCVDPDGEEEIWHPWTELDITAGAAAGELRSFDGQRMSIYEAKTTFTKLRNNYRNGNLILDDCRCYVDAGPEPDMMYMLRRKRQFGLDVFAMAHGFTEVPPKFFTFSTHYVLFSTEDDPARAKQNIPNYNDFMAIKDYVDQKAYDDEHFYFIIDKKKLKAGEYRKFKPSVA